jgi:fructose-1,6-bisphosphatase-3
MLDDRDLQSILARQFSSASSVMAEIALLQAKLTLPKRRIQFISDIHGDDRKLRHAVNNASGGLSNLVNQVFGDELSEDEKHTFRDFLYYPVRKLRRHRKRRTPEPHKKGIQNPLHRLPL